MTPGRPGTRKRFFYYTWRGTAASHVVQAARGHFTRAVHTEFVQHARAGLEFGGLAFTQPRDMEEHVAAAVIRAQEAEAFGFEIGHHEPPLLAGGIGCGRVSPRICGRSGAAGFVANSLLD